MSMFMLRSAKVNLGKSETCLVGQWGSTGIPGLSMGLKWEQRGLKVLGVFLGLADFQRLNWEGILDNVEVSGLNGNGCYLSCRTGEEL